MKKQRRQILSLFLTLAMLLAPPHAQRPAASWAIGAELAEQARES